MEFVPVKGVFCGQSSLNFMKKPSQSLLFFSVFPIAKAAFILKQQKLIKGKKFLLCDFGQGQQIYVLNIHGQWLQFCHGSSPVTHPLAIVQNRLYVE